MSNDAFLNVDTVISTLVDCSVEAKELYLGSHVPYFEGAPTALEFQRNFVSKNLPCIFKNALNHWPALRKWDSEYFRNSIGEKKVTVAVTPNGYADAVYDDQFVLPEERCMLMEEFLKIVEGNDSSGDVYYIQKQNSNLTDEFKELICDVDTDISWASQALDKQPDAINFWMGQEKAVTSLHKDHYENLYCVVKGEKIFTLYPPSDRPFIPYKNYSVAQYKHCKGSWIVESTKSTANNATVPWIAIDVLNPRLDLYPQFKHASPLTCKVKAGEILYLPCLWFHHVQQSNSTIAINYWYDMEFDVKYNYYQTLDKICNIVDEASKSNKNAC